MATILLFDIGNTHITLGAYQDEKLVSTWRITTRVDGTADEYAVMLRSLLRQKGANGMTFDGCAIASSVPSLASTFDELCQRHLHLEPVVVGPGVKTGMNIRTDSPREVGADRISNAVATKKLYGAPAIVIDFSTTATIFDALNAEGDYVGTAIAPGLTTSADALFSHAAQLPRVELTAPASKSPIGKNSVSAVQAGLVYGYVALVEGMITRIKKDLGAASHVIGTGEMVHLIADETRAIDSIDEYLTLEGLKMIYEMNRP
ncbi:MAG TPA: type III pantothenate kinase [Armatimonadota bacterium]|nr:type III pantothenate kinase [Armatimonadota bacterium]